MPPKFHEGEKVLCHYGPLIYEAKCIQTYVIRKNHVQYLVHYMGWNKKWDELVPARRLLKFNRANVIKQKQAQRAHAMQHVKIKKGKKPNIDKRRRIKKRTSRTNQYRRKHSNLYSDDIDLYLATVDARVRFPEELRSLLEKHEDLVTRQGKLAVLPAKFTVENILDYYLAAKKTDDEEKEWEQVEIAKGIKEHFDLAVTSQLLYDSEISQYLQVVKKYPDTPASRVYGAMHLLRLLKRLSRVLSMPDLDEETVELVVDHMQAFLQYLVANKGTLLHLKDYMYPPPDYRRTVQ